MANSLTGYDLSRQWFNWCFENPEKINPNHSAMYFFIIEHCNRLGWKEKFGLPMEMTKEAIGIKNYRTYKKTFDDLIEWNFIKLIEKSKNQFSSCIIAIVQNTKASTKALDKAMIKHSQEQGEKQSQSIVCIDKHTTNNNKPITINNKQFLSENKFSVSNFFKPIFENFYFEKKNEKYYWTGKDVAKCKSLADKLVFKIKEKEKKSGKKEKENYNAELPDVFKFFLSKISDDWILSNLSMAIIDSKFNEIITSKHDGNSTCKNSKSDTATRKQSVANLKNLSESILDDFASKNS